MRKSDFTLPTLDDLFSTQAERDDAKLERVRNIPLAELHPFKGHPFKVQNNEEMQRMIESIRKVGAITPALARPLPDGGYELISGHRRLAACQVLGVETMPVIVRELSDDEAVIAMVDANLQRETILPSEKAFAYKMKLDAIKHQGVTSAQVGQKLLSVEKVADDAGESRNQIKRYIRLTYLIPELLSMVDDGKIAFNPAVELSYLDSYQQRAVLDAMALNDCTPSHAQSIRKVGAITPALARPLPDGGYELISGHRRLAACQVLGVETMPVIVRELSDDEAVIAMVDANLQRETILPSEKAFAYKMKLDALNHQGITSGQVGQKWSREKMADEAIDSGRQIQRYIRLTYLIPELLSMVDDGKIAFNPAVELSYLDSYQQRAVLDAMALNDCTPSHAQSIRLKKLAQEGLLDDQIVYAVLAETKPNQQEQLKFKREELRKYFPSGYTEEQMRRDIIKGLELLKRQRDRNRDAR